jgi:hypothetical protein
MHVVDGKPRAVPAVDVWAEEPGTRVKLERWGAGVRLTIYDTTGERSMTASVADYRWQRLLKGIEGQVGE